MRIITGSARGTKISTLESDATRPTTDKVKEAIFSMIQFDIEGKLVLDLFGGSGQLALEALSRGATKAVIIDQSRDATSIIIENAKKPSFLTNAEFNLPIMPRFCVQRQDVRNSMSYFLTRLTIPPSYMTH